MVNGLLGRTIFLFKTPDIPPFAPVAHAWAGQMERQFGCADGAASVQEPARLLRRAAGPGRAPDALRTAQDCLQLLPTANDARIALYPPVRGRITHESSMEIMAIHRLIEEQSLRKVKPEQCEIS